MQSSVLLSVTLLSVMTAGLPNPGLFSKSGDDDKSWFKSKKKNLPQYDINPNFGFRSYHQIRYEPMTLPFEIEFNPALPPLELSLPNSASPQDLQLLNDGTGYTGTVAKKSSKRSSTFSFLPFSDFFVNLFSFFGNESSSSYNNNIDTSRTSPSSQFGSRQTSYG